MGQRSQIYVRYTNEKGECYLIARYYSWNYAERMVSRAKHALEWIKEMINYDWYFTTEPEKLIRILDTNFDMQDCMISTDIIKEYLEYGRNEKFSDYVFRWYANNDGKLFIDIKNGQIKYAFTDSSCNTSKPLTAARYMLWNHKDWRKSKYISSEQKELCEKNIRLIPKLAQLMTTEELEEFINYNYTQNYENQTDYFSFYELELGYLKDGADEIEYEAPFSCCIKTDAFPYNPLSLLELINKKTNNNYDWLHSITHISEEEANTWFKEIYEIKE